MGQGLEAEKEAIGYALASLEAGIMMFNASNKSELEEWSKIAQLLHKDYDGLQLPGSAFTSMLGMAIAYCIQFCSATNSDPEKIIQEVKQRWLLTTQVLDGNLGT